MSNMRYLDAGLAIVGTILVLIRGFGFLFFASSLPWGILFPAVVVAMFCWLTIALLRERPWVVWALLTLYLVGYCDGGLNRIVEEKMIMPDLLEFGVILYFVFRVMQRSDNESDKAESKVPSSN